MRKKDCQSCSEEEEGEEELLTLNQNLRIDPSNQTIESNRSSQSLK